MQHVLEQHSNAHAAKCLSNTQQVVAEGLHSATSCSRITVLLNDNCLSNLLLSVLLEELLRALLRKGKCVAEGVVEIQLQPIVFGVLLNLVLQSQSSRSLFNRTWQKRHS